MELPKIFIKVFVMALDRMVKEVMAFGNSVRNGNLFRLILKNFLGIMLMFGKLTITVILITNGCDMPVTGYLITGHRNMVLVYWEKYGNNRNIRKIRL